MEKMDLAALQQHTYSIFVEFDRICRKHGIAYSMEGGTLMGAVKFKGFVPWDDDIDVIMCRDQYERFLKIAPAEMDPRFALQSYNTVPAFPLNYAKMCMNGTKICDYPYSHLDMHHGVFIDIFPIDNVKLSTWRKHCSVIGVLTGARVSKLGFTPAVHPLKRIVYGALALLPMKTLIRLLNVACQWYNRKDTGYRYEICNPNLQFKPQKAQVYDHLTQLRFQDGDFSAVESFDDFLKARFGENYMQELPPADLRKPSHKGTPFME